MREEFTDTTPHWTMTSRNFASCGHRPSSRRGLKMICRGWTPNGGQKCLPLSNLTHTSPRTRQDCRWYLKLNSSLFSHVPFSHWAMVCGISKRQISEYLAGFGKETASLALLPTWRYESKRTIFITDTE